MQQNTFEKKLATVRRMLIEQNFELRWHGPPGPICTPITGYFHVKTIISKENFRVDCYLLLKYCRRQCTLLPLSSVAREGYSPSPIGQSTKMQNKENATFLAFLGLIFVLEWAKK